VWRPVLLVPAGIEEHLTPPQLEVVMAHELWRTIPSEPDLAIVDACGRN
jgi:hypothetical protein